MIGLTAPGADERRAYRGLKTPQHLRLDVTWGRAEHINVPAGALVSITNIDGCGSVFLTTLTAKTRNFSTDGLDVPQALAQALGALRFDQREMAQRAATRDTTLNAGAAYEAFSKDTKPGEMFVMKVSQAVALYVIAPISEGYIDEGGGSHFAVQVQPAAKTESPVL